MAKSIFGGGVIHRLRRELDGDAPLQTVNNTGYPIHRWSQRRLRLEFKNGIIYTTIIEFVESLAGRRGSALDR